MRLLYVATCIWLVTAPAATPAADDALFKDVDDVGFAARFALEGAALKLHYGKTNVNDEEDLAIRLDSRERTRGYKIGYFDKKFVLDTLGYWAHGRKTRLMFTEDEIVLTPNKDTMLYHLVWNAFSLDLWAGRERTAEVKADALGVLSRGDVKDRSTVKYSVKYTLDIGAIGCLWIKRSDHSCGK